MIRNHAVALLCVLHVLPGVLLGQLVLSDSSRLSDPRYLHQRIKDISTADLLRSLDPHQPGFAPVRRAAEAKDTMLAFRRWTECRERRPHPRYVTSNDHQLLDTERLVDLPPFREMMRRRSPERDTILSRAAEILRNRIRAWGPAPVDFGTTVDFNREIGRTGKYGFHYWSWSQPLLQAYVLTGDRRLLAKYDTLFTLWYRQRNAITRSIPDFDVVYYELGLGLRNRFFIEYDLQSGPDLPATTRERLMKTLLGAGRWLYELERCEGYRPGNWQMHGSYMLVQLALTYPEFTEAAHWLAMGLRRLGEHAEKDFLEDGGHSEHSPRNYTLATYGLLRNVSYLLSVHGVAPEVAAPFRSCLERTARWWVTMMTPTGEMPAINDSHRGIFPRRILEDAAAAYSLPDVAGAVRAIFGDEGAPAETSVLPAYTSRHMPASGFTVMRSGWTRDALYMVINHGRYSPTHCHNDLLSFEVYAYGRAFAVDAGVGATYDDPDHAGWFMSSRAHNMVVVNDRNVVRDRTEGEEIRWDTTSTVELFSGSHTGYPGVRSRRTVLFVKPSYWLVHDELISLESGDTVSWYFHSPFPIERDSTAWVSGGEPGMRIVPVGRETLVRTGHGRAASALDPEPGKTQQTSWIRLDQSSLAQQPMCFSVFLVPSRSRGRAPVCTLVAPGHLRIETGEFTDEFLFGVGTRNNARRVESDAEWVWIRASHENQRSIAMLGGTFVLMDHRELFRLPARGSLEMSFH